MSVYWLTRLRQSNWEKLGRESEPTNQAQPNGGFFAPDHQPADQKLSVPGTDIPLADALSRYYIDKEKKLLADRITSDNRLTERPLVLNGYNFFDCNL